MATRPAAMAAGGAHPIESPSTPGYDEKPNDIETPPSQQSDSDLTRCDSRQSFDQPIGVTKIEALYKVFGKGWKLFFLWLSIALIAYVWSLAVITTGIYSAFATSSFGKHTVVGLMAVINNIIAAAIIPFLAKICDVLSRPAAIALATFLFTLGYVVVAGAPTVYAVVAGEAIFTAGRTGLYQMMHTLISDTTQLQWRGAVLGAYSLPFVINGFLAGSITEGIRATSLYGGNGWRWGYGMFTIIVPVAVGPALVVLFWGDIRAKKLGALSLASSTYARRRVLEGEDAAPRRTKWQMFMWIVHSVDAIGLLLFTFALVLLLTPPTLQPLAKGGYSNPSLIAMYAVGGILFLAFLAWEYWFARYPICPRRLLNRTFVSCLFVDALHFFSNFITDAYYNSWVFIIKPTWSSRHYTYFSNTYSIGMCIFAAFTGILLYFTKRYKYIQLTGVAIRCLGEGISFMTANGNQKDVTFIMGKIIISMGAGMIITTTAVAAPASVPHADLASSMAILHMIAQLGGSIAGAISASVWNNGVPKRLERYLPELSQKDRDLIFGSIGRARRQKPHDMVNRAYTETMRPLLIVAICTSCLAFVICLFTKEMPLGRAHNNVERHKEVRLRNKEEVTDDAIRSEVVAAEERAMAQAGKVQ